MSEKSLQERRTTIGRPSAYLTKWSTCKRTAKPTRGFRRSFGARLVAYTSAETKLPWNPIGMRCFKRALASGAPERFRASRMAR